MVLGVQSDIDFSKPGKHYVDLSDAGEGSGCVVSADGLVATAFHVIDGQRSLVVRTADGTYHGARVVYKNADHDLALIEISKSEPGQTFNYLKVRDSGKLNEGERLDVVGYADPNYNKSGRLYLSPGRVIGYTRSDISAVNHGPVERYTWESGMLKNSCHVEGGDSGAAIMCNGEVVGINSMHNEHASYGGPATDLAVALRQVRRFRQNNSNVFYYAASSRVED